MIVYLINLSLLGSLIFLFYKKSEGLKLQKHFWVALATRLFAGIALGWVYYFYYEGGDTIVLFNDGVALANYAKTYPVDYLHFLFLGEWGKDQHVYDLLQITNTRAVFMTKTISITNLLTSNNYWLSGIYFSFFSFAGSWFCANKIASTFSRYQILTAISFFYFPSFIFWSSGIIKESLLVGCIGFLVAMLPLAPKTKIFFNWKNLLKTGLFLLLCLVILKIKYYYLGGILAAVSSFYISQFLFPNQRAWQYSGICISFVFILGTSTLFHPNLNIDFFLSALVKNNQLMVEATSKHENLIVFENLSTDWIYFLKNIPKAMWEGMFRPYLWEEGSWLKRISAIESSLIFLISLLAFPVFIKLLFQRKLARWAIPILLYSFLMLCILPIASPNIGNLVRYKVGFSPFLLLLMLIGCVHFTDHFAKFRLMKKLF